MLVLNEKISVTVVIPCYRCKDTIDRAVASVMKQTFLPKEIILVDDYSQDGTLNVLEAKVDQSASQGLIKVISLDENRGPGSARNAGWERASSKYIAFLDADDTWHPQKLELQYVWMLKNPNVVLTGHGTMQLEDECSPVSLNSDLRHSFVSKRKMLISNQFSTRSVMILRTVPFRFCSEKYYSEDYLLWLTIIFSDYPACKFDEVLSYSYKEDFGGKGLSASIWKHEKGELDTFFRLYRLGGISLWSYLWTSIFSLVKFLRRALISVCFKCW